MTKQEEIGKILIRRHWELEQQNQGISNRLSACNEGTRCESPECGLRNDRVCGWP